jgi:hypothetical protein
MIELEPIDTFTWGASMFIALAILIVVGLSGIQRKIGNDPWIASQDCKQ